MDMQLPPTMPRLKSPGLRRADLPPPLGHRSRDRRRALRNQRRPRPPGARPHRAEDRHPLAQGRARHGRRRTAIRQEGDRLLGTLEERLGKHRELLDEALGGTLRSYFDPVERRLHRARAAAAAPRRRAGDGDRQPGRDGAAHARRAARAAPGRRQPAAHPAQPGRRQRLHRGPAGPGAAGAGSAKRVDRRTSSRSTVPTAPSAAWCAS